MTTKKPIYTHIMQFRSFLAGFFLLDNSHVAFNKSDNRDDLIIDDLVFDHDFVRRYARNINDFIPDSQSSLVSLKREI